MTGMLAFLVASGKPPASGAATVNITGLQCVSLSNGNGFNQNYSAHVTGGVGPFTYAWTRTNATFTLGASTSSACPLTHASATNTTAQTDLTVVVTDTGNGNATTSDTVTIGVGWGVSPPC